MATAPLRFARPPLLPLLTVLVGLAPAARLHAQAATATRVPLAPVQRFLQKQPAGVLSRVGAAGTDTVSKTAPSIRLDRTEFLAVRTGAAARGTRPLLRPPTTPPRPDTASPAQPDSTGPSVTAAPQPAGGAAQGDGSEAIVLPFRYIRPDASGTGLWVLRPVIQPAGPLRYRRAEGVFRGSFYVAIQDTLHQGASRELPAPIQLLFTPDADSVQPRETAIGHTNFPLAEVQLVTAQARDSVRVKVIPQFDLSGVDIWLPVQPALVIETPPGRIQGLGVETARVIVSVRGATLRDSVAVRLDATRGSVEPALVRIGPDGSASFTVRSEGLGVTKLRVVSAGFAGDEVAFQYAFPFLFLLAALLGGAAGGAMAGLYARQKDPAASIGAPTVRGLFLGVLAAAAYFILGVNILGVSVAVRFFNEGGVFAFAMLAGAFGSPLLPSLGGGKPAAPTAASGGPTTPAPAPTGGSAAASSAGAPAGGSGPADGATH